MPANDYHFVTHWRVQGTVEEAFEILGKGDLARWWPSVYLDVQELKPGGEWNLGRETAVFTKGWLPYTLRWQFRVADVQYPRQFTIEASGDFVGRGIWTFEGDECGVDITYDWKIRAEKPLLQRFSFLLKPIFSANHRWAMRKGEESLKLELARRHATTLAELALIPPPPGPAQSTPILLAATAAAVAGLFAVALLLARRPR
jgi:hypothetical protein